MVLKLTTNVTSDAKFMHLSSSKSNTVLLQRTQLQPDRGYTPRDTAVDITIILLNILLLYGGLGWLSWCSDSLDRPGIESRWGWVFTHPTRLALGPTQPPIQWVPGLSQWWSSWGVALTTHPHQHRGLRKEYSYTSTPTLSLRGLL
jgi:hypothetical protein